MGPKSRNSTPSKSGKKSAKTTPKSGSASKARGSSKKAFAEDPSSDSEDFDFDENNMGVEDYENSDDDGQAAVKSLSNRRNGDDESDDDDEPEEMKGNAEEMQRLREMFENYESALSAKQKRGKKGKAKEKKVDKASAVEGMEGQLLDASVINNLDIDDLYGDEGEGEGVGEGEEADEQEEKEEDQYYNNRKRIGRIDTTVKKSIRLGNEEIEVTALTGVLGKKNKDPLAIYIDDGYYSRTKTTGNNNRNKSILEAALISKNDESKVSKFSVFASQKGKKGPARAFRTSKGSSRGASLQKAADAAEKKRIKMAKRRGAL